MNDATVISAECCLCGEYPVFDMGGQLYCATIVCSVDTYHPTVSHWNKNIHKLRANDTVSHPKHYQSDIKCKCGESIECIDLTRHLGFNEGNIIKYVWRYKDKNGIEDLKKAQWYLTDLIKSLEGE